MKKKMTAFILIMILLITGISGCSKEENDTLPEQTDKQNRSEQTPSEPSVSEQTAGRYMEENIPLPELSSQERIIKIIENPNKQIEAYSYIVNQTSIEYLCYTLKEDGTWESSTPEWLNNGTLSGNSVLSNLCFDSNGTYYASYDNYDDATAKSQIIMSDDGGKTAKKVDIPYLNEPEKTTEEYCYYFMIEKMIIMENGNFVLSDFWNADTLFVFSGDGEKLDEVTGLQSQDFLVSGSNIISMNEDGSQLVFYNTVKGEIEKTIDYNLPKQFAALALNKKEDGTILLGDSSGIHRLSKDGTLWETTVDGTLNCMSMPALNFNALFITDGVPEDYYTVYGDNEGGYQLKHYVFDENVSAFPEHEITVYSLTENKTIRQAISLFQSQNTDVKVNYMVAMGEEDGNVADYIRALNTELLNGNGADVLILDGLPVDSYIEKGVLGDISDIILPLMESNELLPNITDNYIQDGKIYRLPIRFSIPIIAGKQEALSVISKPENTVDYIQQSGNEPFTIPHSYKSLLTDYFALYFNDLFTERKLSEEEYAKFLENVKKIADNIGAKESLDSDIVYYDSKRGLLTQDNLFNNNIVSFMGNKNACTITTQIKNIMDTIMLYAVVNEFKLDFTSINDTFIPSGTVSLNQASKEIDIAKDFIRFLFSGQVQDGNLYDGFPVNRISLKNWTDKENEGFSMAVSGDGEGNRLSGEWPGKEERERFYQIACSVKVPIETNYILTNMIIDQSLPFFLGQADAKQIASSVKTKINTYLSE